MNELNEGANEPAILPVLFLFSVSLHPPEYKNYKSRNQSYLSLVTAESLQLKISALYIVNVQIG